MKRMKGPDYKDKMVFGVPLIVHVQRYGHLFAHAAYNFRPAAF